MSIEKMTYMNTEHPTKDVLVAIRIVDENKENSAKYYFAYWNGSNFVTLSGKKIEKCQSWQYIKNVYGGYFSK